MFVVHFQKELTISTIAAENSANQSKYNLISITVINFHLRLLKSKKWLVVRLSSPIVVRLTWKFQCWDYILSAIAFNYGEIHHCIGINSFFKVQIALVFFWSHTCFYEVSTWLQVRQRLEKLFWCAFNFLKKYAIFGLWDCIHFYTGPGSSIPWVMQVHLLGVLWFVP